MANSTHSIGFRRLFDAVIANVTQPLEDRLLETWQAGEDKPDASSQMALDVMLIATALHYKRNGLTRGQYAFLGDIYDHILKQDNRGSKAVDEYYARVFSLAQNEHYQEPPTVSLNLLRGYDAIARTGIAPMYQDLLLKIVNVTLTHVEKPTPTDNQIIEEFNLLWTEVVTATKTPQRCFHPETGALAADLNKAVLEFVAPAREVIKAVDQLREMDALRNAEGFIRRTFTNYCAQAVLVDSVVDPRELELFHDLAPTLMFFGNQGSMQNLQEIFQTASKNISPSETPLLVSILDIYDNSMNTELSDRARSLYFRLANTVFKADGTVSPEELEWLEQFKETLYPHGTVENLEQISRHTLAKQPGEKQVIGKMTVDESLDEISSLIGQDRAKQELSQLVNLIKVQQMREEKGLPGTAIPRYLVFNGNPGTGKTSVARILANIYRSLGILKKGHVVEVHRADLVAGNAGHTASKIRQVVSSARGGVLFIDEAYALVQEGGQDSYGQEAVDTLVKAMEDHRDTMVVILAGYPERMARFINANPGLKSRFNKLFQFEDYTSDQMLEIFELFCSRTSFHTSASALNLVKSLFEQLHAERGEGFGNAREVRSVFETIIGNQASRIVSLPQVNEDILSTITDEDVLPIVAALEKTLK